MSKAVLFDNFAEWRNAIKAEGMPLWKPVLDYEVREKDRTLTLQYIPDTHLAGVEKHLKSGDIAVFVQDLPGIFAAHTGMMFKRADGTWVFRNATSLEPKKVVDIPWSKIVESLQTSKRLIGMSFVRPRQP